MIKFWSSLRLCNFKRTNNNRKKGASVYLNRISSSTFIFLSILHNYLKNSGTKMGTNVERINPVENDNTAVSEFVFLETIGSVVSIAVAPAGAIAS